MSNEIAVIDKTKIVEFLDITGAGNNLTENEKKQFVEVAAGCNLNPFKREIYCVAYGKDEKRKLSIITGYEVYIKRALRSGQLNGWKTDIIGTRKDGTLKAVVTIHRKDWEMPFVHEAYWLEYKQDNSFWQNKPVTMIKKVAIAQAFRLCFPDELEGMPYTSDELSDEMTGLKDVTPEMKDISPEAAESFGTSEEQIQELENSRISEEPKSDKKKLMRECAALRNDMLAYAEEHGQCFTEETFSFLNDIDLRALKKPQPLVWMQEQFKRLENRVKEASGKQGQTEGVQIGQPGLGIF